MRSPNSAYVTLLVVIDTRRTAKRAHPGVSGGALEVSSRPSAGSRCAVNSVVMSMTGSRVSCQAHEHIRSLPAVSELSGRDEYGEPAAWVGPAGGAREARLAQQAIEAFDGVLVGVLGVDALAFGEAPLA